MWDLTSHTGQLLWCDNKGLLWVHGGERWLSHNVDRWIVRGVALGHHGLSHRGGFAPRALASNHGCLEGFGGLENVTPQTGSAVTQYCPARTVLFLGAHGTTSQGVTHPGIAP
ncbi:hypothetical protein L3X38_002870 [Prunus dulcis]|uniref:Uncharacterized protein n=1 Tax=Prunus dulcis TaxID=3755 RepID=A0AAD4WUT3_PRUDU|nr:hypothetical protein L3X38_002870 [Prunus dulcis]